MKTTKEIWDSLSINYELNKRCSTEKSCFSMKEEEYVDDMFGRLQVLLSGLEALGHTFTKAQINLKILDRFPKVWEPKATAIQEARNLKTLA